MKQSAYRKHHSTETALIRVTNDILRAVDQQKEVLLILLDLSAAFDTIDHGVLLKRLNERYGICGVALKWLESYFLERQQSVIISAVRSDPKAVKWGVPQGSVFGPLGFTLYMGPIEEIIESHGVSCMFYADDTQVYLSFNSHDSVTASTLVENCVSDIRSWMIANSLMLNDSKTEVVHFSSRFSKAPTDLPFIRVNDCNIAPSVKVRDLGLILDKNITMSQHVTSICQNASFGLYKLGKIRHLLDQHTTELLVHAFITSKLDSCNSLLFGLPDT